MPRDYRKSTTAQKGFVDESAKQWGHVAVVLIAGIAIAAFTWNVVGGLIDRSDRERLQHWSNIAADKLGSTLAHANDLLSATAGLVTASELVTPEEYRTYCESVVRTSSVTSLCTIGWVNLGVDESALRSRGDDGRFGLCYSMPGEGDPGGVATATKDEIVRRSLVDCQKAGAPAAARLIPAQDGAAEKWRLLIARQIRGDDWGYVVVRVERALEETRLVLLDRVECHVHMRTDTGEPVIIGPDPSGTIVHDPGRPGHGDVLNATAEEQICGLTYHVDAVAGRGFASAMPRHLLPTLVAVELVCFVLIGAAVRRGASLRQAAERLANRRSRELIAAQASLVDVSRFQRAILDTLPQIIVATDLDGRITLWNKAAERLLGYSADEVVGRETPALFLSRDEIVAGAADLMLPLGSISETCAAVLRALAGQVPNETRAWTLIPRDKRTFDAEAVATALRDSSGSPVGVLMLATDITRRRAAEALLERRNAQAEEARTTLEVRSQELTRALEMARGANHKLLFQKFALDQHAIVSVTDADGRITYVNDRLCETTGYSRDELVGQTHQMLKSGIHPASVYEDMYRSLTAGLVWNGEICDRAKNGDPIWLDTTIVPFRSPAGIITQYCAIRTDVTRRKAAEQRLEAAAEAAAGASKAKSEFLRNMSHELRTPMTAIIGFIELLNDTLGADSACRDYAHTIRRNADHLLAIVDDILDLSKVEAGILTVDRRRCVLERTLREAASLLQARAITKGLQFRLECAPDLPDVITSDPQRLRQILLNLVGNAIKFTRVGGVTVSARLVNEPLRRIEIDITDSGVGMTDEQCASLFRPFAQIDGAMSGSFGGAGLGLSLSRRLAAMLGGDVAIVRTAVGEGSTVRLVIDPGPPIVDNERDDETTIMAASPDGAAACEPLACRILLAEDGADNQKLIAKLLEKAGASVTVVENGALAVEKTRIALRDEQPFDIVLMDMQMPVMDGYAAAAELRRDGYRGAIIALTAHAMPDDRKKCLDAGCDDYLSKPINRARLIDLARSYLTSCGGAATTTAPAASRA